MITPLYLCYNPPCIIYFACHQRHSVYATPTLLFFGTPSPFSCTYSLPSPFLLRLFLAFGPLLSRHLFLSVFLTVGFNEF